MMAQDPRPDMKRLWESLWRDAVDGDGDELGRDFLHFPKGAPVSDVTAWFRLAHAELDRGVENVVEITVPGLLRPRRQRYAAREVVVDGDNVSTDGVARPELTAKTITRIEWISGRGTVRSIGHTRLHGDINGVLMQTSGVSRPIRLDRAETAHDDPDPAEPRP